MYGWMLVVVVGAILIQYPASIKVPDNPLTVNLTIGQPNTDPENAYNQDIILYEGHNLTLTCYAFPSSLSIYITWYLNNAIIPGGSTEQDEDAVRSSLTRSVSRDDDAGQFRCTATDTEDQVDSNVITVTVWYGPLLSISPGPFIFAWRGDDVSANCTYDSNMNMSMNWSKGNTILGTETTLLVENITEVNEGIYVCAVYLSYDGEDVPNINVTRTKTVTMKIIVMPEDVNVIPSFVSVTEGSQFLVNCSADAVPPATFIWLRDGEYFQDGPILFISSSRPDDAAVFTCNASNDYGFSTAHVDVNVNFMPKIVRVIPKFVSVTEGSHILVNCSTDAVPPATFIWLRDGEYFQDGPILFISSSAPDHRAVFTCNASNDYGFSAAHVDIIVNFMPRNVHVTPTFISVTEGSQVLVTCSAYAVPDATYMWLRDGQYFEDGSVLFINYSSPDDDATFTCNASNYYGFSTADVEVKVTGNTVLSDGTVAGISVSVVVVLCVIILIVTIVFNPACRQRIMVKLNIGHIEQMNVHGSNPQITTKSTNSLSVAGAMNCKVDNSNMCGATGITVMTKSEPEHTSNQTAIQSALEENNTANILAALKKKHPMDPEFVKYHLERLEDMFNAKDETYVLERKKCVKIMLQSFVSVMKSHSKSGK